MGLCVYNVATGRAYIPYQTCPQAILLLGLEWYLLLFFFVDCAGLGGGTPWRANAGLWVVVRRPADLLRLLSCAFGFAGRPTVGAAARLRRTPAGHLVTACLSISLLLLLLSYSLKY